MKKKHGHPRAPELRVQEGLGLYLIVKCDIFLLIFCRKIFFCQLKWQNEFSPCLASQPGQILLVTPEKIHCCTPWKNPVGFLLVTSQCLGVSLGRAYAANVVC